MGGDQGGGINLKPAGRINRHVGGWQGSEDFLARIVAQQQTTDFATRNRTRFGQYLLQNIP
jgi:hypothetical protein